MRKIACAMVLAILVLSGLAALSSTGGSGAATRGPYHNASLQVNVTQSDSSPGSGLTVKITNLNTGKTASYLTDRNGFVRIDLSPDMWGPLRIAAANSARQFVRSTQIFAEPDGIYNVSIMLGLPAPEVNWIYGSVRDGITRASLPGATVIFTATDRVGNSIRRTASTNATGRYTFTFPEATGLVSVEARNTGYNTQKASYFFIPGDMRYIADFLLTPTTTPITTTTLRFFDPTDDSTVQGDRITATGWFMEPHHVTGYEDHPLLPNMTFLPGGNGVYNPSLKMGEYKVVLSDSMDGGAVFESTHYIYINLTNNLEIPIQMREMRALTVRVTDGAAPISGATVHYDQEDPMNPWNMYRGSAITDSAGSATIPVPATMLTRVSVNMKDFAPRWLMVNPSMEPLSVDVDMERANAAVRIVPTDVVSAFNVPGTINATLDGNFMIRYSFVTNDTGVFVGTIVPGLYSRMEAKTSLGIGVVENVTVSAGSNPEITIPVTRVGTETTLGTYRVRILAATGGNLSFVPFILELSNPRMKATVMADEMGYINFVSGPGTVKLGVDETFTFPRTRWALPDRTFAVTGSGGTLDSITAYSTTPLGEVSGVVRDSQTRRPLPDAIVNSISYELISGYMGSTPPIDTVDPLLFRMDVGSDTSGFYRIWGRHYVFLTVNYPGYAPHNERLFLSGTGALREHTINLEPIIMINTFVNGTIVNSTGAPVKGWVYAIDTLDPEMKEIAWSETGDDGNFSLRVMPGRLRLFYGSGLLMANRTIDVSRDIEDLILRLEDRSVLTVLVNNTAGEFLPGIDVTLQRSNGTAFSSFMTNATDTEGRVMMTIRSGTYRISIPAMMGYLPYESEPFNVIGGMDLTKRVMLENLTFGIVNGTVIGTGGPFANGIPNVIVSIMNETNVTLASSATNNTGNYSILNVPFGMNLLAATPPENLLFVNGTQAGYLPMVRTISVDSDLVIENITLEYRNISVQERIFNMTEFGPTGDNVSLNKPITMVFDKPVDSETIQDAFVITPAIQTVTAIVSEDNLSVRIMHDPFLANTTFNISVGTTLMSLDGARLAQVMSWNFTTGTFSDWEIFEATVKVDNKTKNLTVNVEGLMGLEVFIVIDGVGSFPIPETTPAMYVAVIPGTNFAFDTTYNYHFSNVTNGTDMASTLSGTFKTPKQGTVGPPPGWMIVSVKVTVDRDSKDWKVEVVGNTNMTIYIVIDTIGSFKLEDDQNDGNYSATIDGSNFERKKTYTYHFSPTVDGPVPPGFKQYSGEAEVEEEEESTDWTTIILISVIALLIILAVLAVIIYFIMRGSRETAWENPT